MPVSAHSIFLKCIAILVLSCSCLAGLVSFLGDRAGKEIAVSGVVTMAQGKTSSLASHLYGPVRFSKSDDIDAVLAETLAASDLVTNVIVMNTEGQVVSSSGPALQPVDMTTLTNLANDALEANAMQERDGGLLLAYPINREIGGEAVGAIAAIWTTEPFLVTIAKYQKKQLLGSAVSLVLLTALSTFAIRSMISRPIERISVRALGLADGDFDSETPDTDNKGEIGELARSIDQLRGHLLDAQKAQTVSLFRSAGFNASSAAMLMCDLELTITNANSAFETLMVAHAEFIRTRSPKFDPDEIIGQSADIFYGKPTTNRETLVNASFPYKTEIEYGPVALSLTIVPVDDEKGERQGYVLEWADVTESRKSLAIMEALEEASLRADFNQDGKLISTNERLRGIGLSEVASFDLQRSIWDEKQKSLWPIVSGGAAHFGRMQVEIGNQRLLIDGSISPIKNAFGNVSGYVLLGSDVTEAEARLEAARISNEEMSKAQSAVVSELREAMTALSTGDLRFRIEKPFGGEYEMLRSDYNSAVGALDEAIREILISADTIHSEAESVSGAADAFSRRTEQQAATLEQTAAAISQLTASVASAAQGAKQANDVVAKAREDAASSGTIVQETVSAMGEIENSAQQISRIIGVIDEIAFQTNLLALNAGVEAARAGDAGRGFAVVASEVRALAQRSSDAAQEISQLISTSGEHVKKGVSLVDKAGDALTGIASTIGDVADHVSEIAASAREQATGLDEINTAMNQLDQVTQKNVAMFEETMAASQSLTSEADGLVTVTRRFECTTDAAKTTRKVKPRANEDGSPTWKSSRGNEPDIPQRPIASAGSNLAVATADEAAEDWEEF